MPELPEVEVCRQGLLPRLTGARIRSVRQRPVCLRQPLPEGLDSILAGRQVRDIRRRGKYLLFACQGSNDLGYLIVHLGMSGCLHFVAPETPMQRHDHLELRMEQAVLRYTDPRRFGLVLWYPGEDPEQHPALASLGIEPLSTSFTGAYLHGAVQRRHTAIKNVLMDAHTLVGVGNIYASESLFRAELSPRHVACRLAGSDCCRLAQAIRLTLEQAIAAGGSSLRDYRHSDGGCGHFQLECAVYGKAGQDCPRCGGQIVKIRQAGRSSFYCPDCQRE